MTTDKLQARVCVGDYEAANAADVIAELRERREGIDSDDTEFDLHRAFKSITLTEQ